MFETLRSCSCKLFTWAWAHRSLEIWWSGINYFALELKLCHSPYVCIRKPCICNVFRPRATWGAGLRAYINVTIFIQFSQNWSIGCLLALYGSTMHPAHLCGSFWTIFFLLSVWAPGYTLREKNYGQFCIKKFSRVICISTREAAMKLKTKTKKLTW